MMSTREMKPPKNSGRNNLLDGGWDDHGPSPHKGHSENCEHGAVDDVEDANARADAEDEHGVQDDVVGADPRPRPHPE